MGINKRATRTRRIASCAAALAAALLLAWGCCVGATIKIGRIGDFLNGVIAVSAEVSIDAFTSFSFDGDFAAWADIPAFAVDAIEADLSTAVYTSGEASLDIDYDAADEGLALLAADDPALSEPMLFAAWSGDKYTMDEDVCYLGWLDANSVHIAAGRCGDGTGVMYCWRPDNGMGDPYCELCESGGCAPCDMTGDLDDCLPPAPSSGSIDLDVDVDIDIDIDIDVDNGTGGAP
jgi:hypothetical protein